MLSVMSVSPPVALCRAIVCSLSAGLLGGLLVLLSRPFVLVYGLSSCLLFCISKAVWLSSVLWNVCWFVTGSINASAMLSGIRSVVQPHVFKNVGMHWKTFLLMWVGFHEIELSVVVIAAYQFDG